MDTPDTLDDDGTHGIHISYEETRQAIIFPLINLHSILVRAFPGTNTHSSLSFNFPSHTN